MINTRPDLKQIDFLFSKISEGFAYCKIITDETEKPVDWVYLDVNEAYERINGVKKEAVLGKKATEVLPNINRDPADWLNLYGKVASTGEPIVTERYSMVRQKWYHISAYSPQRGYFVSIFEDITDRKKAEADLKNAKIDWERTFDAVPDFIAVLDTHHKIVRANRSMTQQLGVTPEKAVGLLCYEYVHGTRSSPAVCPHTKLLKDGKEHTAEVHEPRLGGDFIVSATPLRDEKGNLVGSVHVAHNITERKKAEEALKTTLNRFYTTLSNLHGSVLLVSADGQVEFVNQSFVDYFNLKETPDELRGLTSQEIINKVKKSYLHPDKEAQRIAEILAAGKLIFGEEIAMQDGRTCLRDFIPLHFEAGAYSRLWHHMDITKQKQTEEDLRESREWWSTTLSSIGDAVIATDTEGKVTFLNSVAEKLTGWTLKEAEKKPVTEIFRIITERTRHSVESPVEKVLKQGLIVGLANHTVLIRKDGSEVPIDDSGAPILGEDGEICGVVLVFRDITQRKKDEDKLLKLNRTLRAISNSNQALMYATDETSFLQKACKIILEDCGYKMVWVGLAEDDAEKTVHPVAYAGFDEGYLKTLKISWADTERGRGPTGRAIRTGKPQFCENMQTDPLFEPWRAEALKRGFASSIALPLISTGKIFGALTLYSTNPTISSSDEVNLLTELAGDFAHGIMMLRLREEKERAEAQIHRQAALIDLSPDAIIVRKMDGTITFWSKGAEKLYGWTKKEALGKNTHELLATAFPQLFDNIVSELKTKQGWSGEIAQKTKAGREVVMQSCWLAEKTEHGQISSILESNVDITERKKAEKEIERLASFPILNPSPVVEVNVDGKITFINPAAKALFPALEELGLNHIFFFDWANVASVFADKNTGTSGREVKIGGHWYHQQLYLVQQTQQIRIYCTDIDELKQAEEARVKAQRLVEEYANQMEALAEQRAQQLQNSERLAAIGQTAGMVGHDIRNPLQAITSDIYLISEEAKTMKDSDNKQAIMESVESVNQNLSYINKIISDLQDYTRPLKPNLQDANLSELVEGTLLTINVPKGVEVVTKISDAAKPLITDVAYMRRILTNLITNAVQAMEDAGTLTVKADAAKGFTTITIQDTGVGIPEEVKEKMFTPLFTTKSKGQGLGLAVVKRLVEALRGTIEFESETGTGTKFTLAFPQTNHP